ncbi:MAG: hypothetical protein HQ507_11375 [Candidatus Marinimicrobia bacterium]|nr:hypothetical protein [Candidatus Neomarinimicrobiota bacterium]
MMALLKTSTKFFSQAFILFGLLSLSNCIPSGRVEVFDLGADEGLVAGKLTVLYNGKDVSREAIMLFNEIWVGKFSYRGQTDGYIITKLPLGQNHIARIAYLQNFLNLDITNTGFYLSERSKMTYIGDIIIDWKGPRGKIPAGIMFGLLGAIIDEAIPDGTINLITKDNEAETVAYVNQALNLNMESNKSLVMTTLTHSLSDSLTPILSNQPLTVMEAPLSHDHIRIVHSAGNPVSGSFLAHNKNKLYFENQNILYVVHLEEIESMSDSSGEVSVADLDRIANKSINFNSYKDIITLSKGKVFNSKSRDD